MSPLTSFKLSELADILEVELDGNPDTELFGLSSLDLASERDISFISRESFIPQLQSTNAAAIICSKALSDHYKGSKLISDDPYLLYAKCSSLFKSKPLQNPGISKLASVDSSASVADSAVISNFVSVSKNSIIEDDVILMPGVFIGNDTVVRKGTIIHSNASIYESIEIGEGCIIHSGVVIGSDGLGFAKTEDSWEKIEHLGSVELKDNVEVGASCTIDRASLGTTILNSGVKLDNQVHIAHNCNIGKNTIIGAKTAIAGSTVIGEDCLIGGGCGIVDNIKIENGVRINPMTYITSSIKKSGIYSGGSVVLEHSKWLKHITIQKKAFDD